MFLINLYNTKILLITTRRYQIHWRDSFMYGRPIHI